MIMLFGFLAVVCVVSWMGLGRCHYGNEDVWTILLAVSMTTLVLLFVVWPVVYFKEISNIEDFKAKKEVVENFGFSKYNIERATIAQLAANENGWLRRKKYWNDGFWDIFIPDEVMELEYIK